MSGSGSTCFGIAASQREAQLIVATLTRGVPGVVGFSDLYPLEIWNVQISAFTGKEVVDFAVPGYG